MNGKNYLIKVYKEFDNNRLKNFKLEIAERYDREVNFLNKYCNYFRCPDNPFLELLLTNSADREHKSTNIPKPLSHCSPVSCFFKLRQ